MPYPDFIKLLADPYDFKDPPIIKLWYVNH
jgi:hypothetical protein